MARQVRVKYSFRARFVAVGVWIREVRSASHWRSDAYFDSMECSGLCRVDQYCVCTLQCLLGFASAAHAQCGVGWALAAGDGPGAYEICYDESRARTVLFGGTTTYEWDGVAWETVAISGPPERGAGALVYDPIGARCLLFGGYSSAGARKDLWSWNGIAWTQLSAGPESVSGRGDFAMAFDRGRNRLVVHGGWPGGGGGKRALRTRFAAGRRPGDQAVATAVRRSPAPVRDRDHKFPRARCRWSGRPRRRSPYSRRAEGEPPGPHQCCQTGGRTRPPARRR